MTFNQQVYALVRRIPQGKVLTYGAVAGLLEKPRGARAVGWALHQLPPDTDVPWHRVINSAGRISTRSREHFAYEQRRRLQAEGVEFDETNPLDEFKVRHFNAIKWLPSPWEIQDILDDQGITHEN